ncbi:MAG: HIT domain-containing protein [Candidatus Rokuibacteriota bacterium]
MNAADCPACLARWPDAAYRIAEEVSRMARALAVTDQARKINDALLGNQIPHVHWHVMPRLAGDPAPREPVWSLHHESRRLAAGELAARVAGLRRALGG